MSTKFNVKLIVSEYAWINDDYTKVETSTEFVMSDWDDTQNLIAYMVEGKNGKPVKVEIKTVKEKEAK